MSPEFFFTAGFVYLADQLTKMLVVRSQAGRRVHMGPWVKINVSMRTKREERPALRGAAPLLLWWGAALAGILLVTESGFLFQGGPAKAGLGAALGGAAGNLCDKIRLGAVVDFIDLGWWPVFNLADVAITIGAVVALWFIR